MTPSAASQQFKALEEQIGTVLVTRRERNVGLIEAGERYSEMISVKVEGFVRAADAIQGRQ